MISVVIPLYNKEKSITTTLESVLAQTYTDYEVVVVDDGSTDSSAEVVRSMMAKSNKIRLIQKPNGGVCSARNRGILEAKGYYIALLDGDDIWDKDFLKEQVLLIHDFPEAAMWGINFAETRKGKIVRKVATALPDGYRGYVGHYFEMPKRVSDLFCSSSVVIRRDVFDKVGMFDERIKYAEDSDMWFRIIATEKVAFYDKYMVFYQWDAENRAMQRKRDLRYFLPYYVGKYRNPMFKKNAAFYRWINRWAANILRRYYFDGDSNDRKEAKVAMKDIDYVIVPFKYRLLFKWPYGIAKVLDKLDKMYHK